MTSDCSKDAIPELSIVIPCYNEEDNVAGIHAAVKADALAHAKSHEIIFIDNLSSDRTRDLLREICANDLQQSQLRLNAVSNVCHLSATGRAVVGICADFQALPEMIGPFLKQW